MNSALHKLLGELGVSSLKLLTRPKWHNITSTRPESLASRAAFESRFHKTKAL
jgi:hypothetical protein